jgi:hypothetical protein
MRMKNRKQFAHRIDMWDEDGAHLVDHLAGVEDLDVAAATYRATADAGRKPRSRYGRAPAWWKRTGERDAPARAADKKKARTGRDSREAGRAARSERPRPLMLCGKSRGRALCAIRPGEIL